MFPKIIILNLLFLFNLTLNVYAGWPKDGWMGVESLDIPYCSTVVKLNDDHRNLSHTEEWLTRTLPTSDRTNIVLGRLLFVGEGGTQVHGLSLDGPKDQPYIFESGWEVSLRQNPLEIAQEIMRSHAQQLQKGERLNSEQQRNLVADVKRIAQIEEAHRTGVNPPFEVYCDKIPVSEILTRAKIQLRNTPESDPVYPFVQKLQQDQSAYDKIEAIGVQAKTIVLQRISRAIEGLDEAETAETMDVVLRDIETAARSSRERLLKQQKELESIGSKVIATYWHSEQKFLKFLEDSMDAIFSQSPFQSLEFVPRMIVLQLHSRFDICSFCGHVLARALTQPDGILERFRQAIVNRLGLDSQTPLYLTSSFREERNNAQGHFTVERGPFNGFEDLDQIKQKPAFPLMHIPSPSE